MSYPYFILILGHGRSGTSLCANLLNQHPDLNIGLEINNSEISNLFEKNQVLPGTPLKSVYNGNKIVRGFKIPYVLLWQCITEGIWIVHKEHKGFKVIFIKRSPVSTILSQYRRYQDKGGREEWTVPFLVERYKETDYVLRKLKISLREIGVTYHSFDFDKAIDDELHRKWLYDFAEIKYDPWYSDTYYGAVNYIYGSIHESNSKHGGSTSFPHIRRQIEKEMIDQQVRPWKSILPEEINEFQAKRR